jgi:DNA-directed RNA polymerase beta' subunit
MFNRCPGQDNRQTRAEDMVCVHCGYVAEIFSDELKVVCPECRNLIYKEKQPACTDWCKAARECVGEEKWKQIKGGAECFAINVNKPQAAQVALN